MQTDCSTKLCNLKVKQYNGNVAIEDFCERCPSVIHTLENNFGGGAKIVLQYSRIQKIN